MDNHFLKAVMLLLLLGIYFQLDLQTEIKPRFVLNGQIDILVGVMTRFMGKQVSKRYLASANVSPYRSGLFLRWCLTKFLPGNGIMEPLTLSRTCIKRPAKELGLVHFQ